MPQLLGRGHTVKAETGNQYVVTRRLGEGQFAEVWEVKQSTGGDLRVSWGCGECGPPAAVWGLIRRVCACQHPGYRAAWSIRGASPGEPA